MNIKKSATILFLFFVCGIAWAQTPQITYFEPLSGPVGSLVSITGSGFSDNKADLLVRFGAATGEIMSSTTTLIEVKVPAGATFGSIEVTNLVSHLVAYSEKQFLLSYEGSTFDQTKIEAQLDFPAATELFDICACDFDGDGKVDIGTATLFSTQPYVYRNNSSNNAIAFTRQNLSFLPGVVKAITCSDLNADGKPEIILSRGDVGNSYFFHVLPNKSSVGTISFGTYLSYHNPTEDESVNHITVRDLDGDGLPEVITTNLFDNKIFIFKNLSTSSAVKLNDIPVTITVDGAANSADIEAVDLDGDLLADLVITPANSQNLYVLKNTTTTRGNFTFTSQTITAAGKFREMALAEINGDGKTDFAITSDSDKKVYLLTNTSSGGTISFSQSSVDATGVFGIGVGDVNGDELTDILASNTTGTTMQLFINTTTNAASPTFQAYNIPSDPNTDSSPLYSREMEIVDVSGDGKPDLVFTTFDKVFSKYNLSVSRNLNCVEPEISPSGSMTVCAGQTIRITATPALFTDYIWKEGGTPIATTTTNILDYTTSGSNTDITVTVQSHDGNCANTSEPLSLVFDPAAFPNPPTLTDPAPVCEGSNVTLMASTSEVSPTFIWRGPSGFTSSVQNPMLSNVTPDMAGKYYLAVQNASGCISDEDSLVLEVIPPPIAAISAQGSSVICAGQSSIVLVVDGQTDFTIQWQLNGSNIAGATGTTYSASAAGNYTVSLTAIAAGCSFTTDPFTVSTVNPPVANFSSPPTGCVGVQIAFSDLSTSDTGRTPSYSWDFGDGSTGSTDKNPVHTYSTAGTFTITQTVNYGDATCQDVKTGSISIIDSPVISIASDTTKFCTGDTLTLTAQGTYTSLLWSTSETTPVIKVTAGGTYSVTATNDQGCEASADIILEELPLPVVTLAADPTSVSLGGSTQLTATATGTGVFTYSWQPTTSLDNPNVYNPLATPDSTTTYTVKVTGDNGCFVTDSLKILVDVKLTPKKVFSPNADGYDDFWIIGGIEQFQGCTVIIFDRQGKKVYEKTGYDNTNGWNATTTSGKELPEGAYYFIIKCENEVAKTGSVLVVR